MQKRLIPMVIVVLLTLTMMAHAAEPRAISSPILTFDGTTAKCSVICRGDNTTDKVNATLTLYQGSTFVDSWSGSGTYRVPVSGSAQIKSGKEYRLVLTWSINGISQPSVATTSTCP